MSIGNLNFDDISKDDLDNRIAVGLPLNGSLTISSGKVTVENIIIK